jgi:hypothetical protein
VSGRRGGALLLALIILAIQVGVPVLALFDSRPARFGWQMYSTLNPAPQASVEDASGNLLPVDLDALIADPRAEIRWSAPLAGLLCRDGAAVAVVVTDRDGTTRVPCP